jgi:hypothetical protein
VTYGFPPPPPSPGCDGSESERSYYRRFAQKLPKESVVLTLGCAKYRFNKLPFGTVPGTGIPRLLDIGQCNDSYSAVQIALALASAFKTDINSLPLYVAHWQCLGWGWWRTHRRSLPPAPPHPHPRPLLHVIHAINPIFHVHKRRACA